MHDDERPSDPSGDSWAGVSSSARLRHVATDLDGLASALGHAIDTHAFGGAPPPKVTLGVLTAWCADVVHPEAHRARAAISEVTEEMFDRVAPTERSTALQVRLVAGFVSRMAELAAERSTTTALEDGEIESRMLVAIVVTAGQKAGLAHELEALESFVYEGTARAN